jgi:hypothetical protein
LAVIEHRLMREKICHHKLAAFVFIDESDVA